MIIYTKKHHPLCFNSTLVQLKESQTLAYTINTTEFQFYLSSIKRYSYFFSFIKQLLFQFYLSSIKSRVSPYHSHVISCFNSTLVQLKDFYLVLYLGFWFSFNSTLVQLKVPYFTVTFPVFICFNSTLVQLKV